MARKKKAKSELLKTDERHYRAYQLRLAGASLRDIAEVLGYKFCSGAAQAVKAGQKKYVIDGVGDMHQQNTDRLEALLKAIWTSASKGRLGSVDRATRLIAELNKMHGTYQPEGVELNLTGGPLFVTEVKHVAPQDDTDSDSE